MNILYIVSSSGLPSRNLLRVRLSRWHGVMSAQLTTRCLDSSLSTSHAEIPILRARGVGLHDESRSCSWQDAPLKSEAGDMERDGSERLRLSAIICETM